MVVVTSLKSTNNIKKPNTIKLPTVKIVQPSKFYFVMRNKILE